MEPWRSKTKKKERKGNDGWMVLNGRKKKERAEKNSFSERFLFYAHRPKNTEISQLVRVNLLALFSHTSYCSVLARFSPRNSSLTQYVHLN